MSVRCYVGMMVLDSVESLPTTLTLPLRLRSRIVFYHGFIEGQGDNREINNDSAFSRESKGDS